MIYHIGAKDIIKGIFSTGFYKPGGLINEGFVHCSTKEQVITVANRFYSDQNDLILLEIDDVKLKPNVVYENLEGGSELFPHVYGPIPIRAITSVAMLPKEMNGFSFPQDWSSIESILTW